MKKIMNQIMIKVWSKEENRWIPSYYYFKPGLIPPYYADLPKSFDEIIESERNYLKEKESSPIITDINYFLRAMSNIFLGARSK